MDSRSTKDSMLAEEPVPEKPIPEQDPITGKSYAIIT